MIGIVGSDPYLAPEVYDEKKYDPTATDVWSLAIIFCCMTLRRFPWKQPRLVDNSYKLFVATPTPGSPVTESGSHHNSAHRSREKLASSDGQDEKASADTSHRPDEDGGNHHPHHHHPHPVNQKGDGSDEHRHHSHGEGDHLDSAVSEKSSKNEVIRGPWRLLRILPRESRHIIGRMLKVEPEKRATMEEVLEDHWLRTTPVCHQDDSGEVHCVDGHEHTLEAGSAPQPQPEK